MPECNTNKERCLALLRAQRELLAKSEGTFSGSLVSMLNNSRGPHTVLLTDCTNPEGVARVQVCCAPKAVREWIAEHVGIGSKSRGLRQLEQASNFPPAQTVKLPVPIHRMLPDPNACLKDLEDNLDLSNALLARLGCAQRTSAYAIVLPARDVKIEAPDPLLAALTASAMYLQIQHLRTAGFNGGKKFAELLDNVPNIAVQGYHTDGTVVYWNRANESLYGWTAEEAVGRNVLDLIIPSHMRSEAEQIIATGAKTGKMPPPSEAHLIRKDGQSVPVYSAHAVVDEDEGQRLLFCMDVDLRPMRRMEEQLNAMRERVNLAQELAEIGYWDWDLATNSATLSAQAARLFDIPCDGDQTVIPHKDLAEKLHSLDRPHALMETRAAVEQMRHASFEARVQPLDAHLRWLEVTGGPASNNPEDGRRFLGVVKDITERKKQEKEHQRLENTLHRQRKSESLSRLAGGIAHHLNNILTAMLGNADLLEEHLIGDDAGQKLLEEIHASGRRAADIASQMLAYLGHGGMVARPAKLSVIAAEVANKFREALPENVILATEIDETDTQISCDRTRIEQVLLSLLNNAIESLPEQTGSITVSAGASQSASETTETSHFYGAGNLPSGPCVWCEVRDTGSGIKPGEIESIFDPFYTTHLTGRGLGLPTALGIMRAHHGGLIVESAVGKGTTVRLVLPQRG